MNHKELYDRLCKFADRVAVFAEPLFDRRATANIADQLTRAAEGAAANYRASHYGRSHAEFRSKLSQALEEADETRHWLGRLQRRPSLQGPTLDSLAAESIELCRILGASVTTANRNSRHPSSGRQSAGAAGGSPNNPNNPIADSR